jgi:hypothetical protein
MIIMTIPVMAAILIMTDIVLITHIILTILTKWEILNALQIPTISLL